MTNPLNSPQKTRLGIMVAFGAAVTFGLYPSAIRAVYADGGNASFVLVTVMWARALSLYFYCLFTGKKIYRTREDVRQGLIGGIFQAVATASLIGALVYLPGPIVLIILFSHTLMLLFYLAWRGEIKLDAATVVVTVVALFGLGLVLDLWHTQSASNLIGMALAFLMALVTVSRMYIWGRQTRDKNPAIVGAETFLFAATLTTSALFFQAPQLPHTGSSYGWLALAAASLSLGTFGIFYGISLLGSFRWSLYSKLEPVFTTIFAALLIHEVLKIQQYIGIAAVLGSLALYQYFERRKQVPLQILPD